MNFSPAIAPISSGTTYANINPVFVIGFDPIANGMMKALQRHLKQQREDELRAVFGLPPRELWLYTEELEECYCVS